MHGFASGALLNWHQSGWTRDLVRAGYRVVALDQRGHGASAKPHDPGAYSMDHLVADVVTVVDTYLLDDVAFLGYSLGARVGWHTAERLPDRISRAVFGGIPDADPMRRVRVDQAKQYLADARPSRTAAQRVPDDGGGRRGERPRGARGDGGGDAEQHRADTRERTWAAVLMAAGSEDGIRTARCGWSDAAPDARFFEIPGRNHFNAPTSRAFREAAIAFLGD